MTVTIVICTHNRAQLLAQTLDGLASMTPVADVSWDVLVVDNASTDGTAAFLAGYRASYPFRHVHEPRPGKSNALNFVLETVMSDYLLFTDDDVLVDPAWLEEFVRAVRRNPEAAGFGGRIVPWFPTAPEADLVAAFPALKRGFCGLDYGEDEKVLPDGKDAVGANIAFRRSAVAGLQFRVDLGVNQGDTIGGEELEFQQQVRARGGKIVWVPAMSVRHYVDPRRMTLDYLLRFAEDAGRREIRLLGAPGERGVGGVPWWLFRQAVEFHLRMLLSRLRGRRQEALSWQRNRAEAVGMIKESRYQHMRRQAPARHASRVSTL